MGRYDDYYGYKPYVPVAQRRAEAAREVARRAKKGQKVCPVRIEGRTIASTFWGKAWCTNLESYSDFENRLPRGRTYVRNGSVVHLEIDKGRIKALVSGSELYEVQIDIAELPKPDWPALKKQCAGKIGSLVELLQGDGVGDGSESGALSEAQRDQDAMQLPGLCGDVQARGCGDVRSRKSPRFVARVAVRTPGRGSHGIDRTGDPHGPDQGRERSPHDRDRRSGSHLRYRNRRRSGCESGHQDPRKAGIEESREEGSGHEGSKSPIREESREEGSGREGEKSSIGSQEEVDSIVSLIIRRIVIRSPIRAEHPDGRRCDE
jgi:hypothetical protein